MEQTAPILEHDTIDGLRALGAASGVAAMRAELESVRRALPAALPPVVDRPARVVVADDEPHVARLVAFVLSRAGYDVTVVGDGLGVLDALARLRAVEGPVPTTLILTARATADATGEILAAGAAAHCLKPIAPTTLLRQLAEAGVPPRVARRESDGAHSEDAGPLVNNPPRGGSFRAPTDPGGPWTGSLDLHGRRPVASPGPVLLRVGLGGRGVGVP